MILPRAVLLDALGTLLALEPPAPLLRDALRARLGVEVEMVRAQRAMAAEMAYYRAHHREGRDAESLAALRARCARVVADALGPPVASHADADVLDVLLAALRFTPFPEAASALQRLRSAGMRLVVVSNWDCSLHGVLEAAGLRQSLDGVVTSAEAGAAKPDPVIFARALELAGVPAQQALHVGDSWREDVEGARAAGLEAVLVERDRSGPSPVGVRTISSLDELQEPAA